MRENENSFKPNLYSKEHPNTLRRVVLWVTIGMLVPTIACSAITAIACEQTQGLPGSAPEISANCTFPMNRSVHIAIGGLEPIPGRQIRAFEVFSFPNDGSVPLDDVHIQVWWEIANNGFSFPQDLPPIIRIGR